MQVTLAYLGATDLEGRLGARNALSQVRPDRFRMGVILLVERVVFVTSMFGHATLLCDIAPGFAAAASHDGTRLAKCRVELGRNGTETTCMNRALDAGLSDITCELILLPAPLAIAKP